MEPDNSARLPIKPSGPRELVKSLPLVNSFMRTDAWRAFRHWTILLSEERDPRIPFTRFNRLPAQLAVLTEHVIPLVASAGEGRPLSILVFGCSNGAEAYSISSALLAAYPGLEFQIHASDINPESVEKAKTATYSRAEVFCVETERSTVTPKFVAETFLERNDTFVIRPEVASRVSFEVADALDGSKLQAFGAADIVFAQNFLFNLTRKKAVQVFRNVVTLLKPHAALFIEGMDYDLRSRLTRRVNLAPIEDGIEAIHEDARIVRAGGWPYHYWGLEPFRRSRADWKRRYATIFIR